MASPSPSARLHQSKKTILVTGGAGFIGSHLVDALVALGHTVRVFDNLEVQVHGNLAEQNRWPEYANPLAEYILGDVRDLTALEKAVAGVEVIYHFAAATGVGQSMMQLAKYAAVNVQGTANLLEALIHRSHTVEKIILASSRAVYGEGWYQCSDCGPVAPPVRTAEALERKSWEISCPQCGKALRPLPTPESKIPAPGSIYAITKLTQEQLCLTYGQAYRIPTIALRFFNVYGLRQSLTNPYTGIISAFLQRLLNGQSPEVYEDGQMTRDFVYISDVVAACLLALDYPRSTVMNIGSGQFTTILELARTLCAIAGSDIRPRIVGVARLGDIRHCSADLQRAVSELKFHPSVSLGEGLQQIWADASSRLLRDLTAIARQELQKFGLLK
jgi:dTDP-L-rhamnose 4-epimerase